MKKYKHEVWTIFKESRRKTHKKQSNIEILITYRSVYKIIAYQKDMILKTKEPQKEIYRIKLQYFLRLPYRTY